MPRITNITELRNELLDSFEMLQKDPKRVVQVGELANTAGKIINSCKVQLEYAHLRKTTPTIPFLEG